MPHRPTDEDKKLWNHVTKGIEPYHPEKKWQQEEGYRTSETHKKKMQPQEQNRVTLPKDPQVRQSGAPATLDRRTKIKLKRGRIEIEGRIDLHGMTQEVAYDELIRFISQSFEQGKRCVLVITGKGRLSAPGKIKQNLPSWLYEYPLTGIVLQHMEAQPSDGGAGAFYVYLKRQRDLK